MMDHNEDIVIDMLRKDIMELRKDFKKLSAYIYLANIAELGSDVNKLFEFKWKIIGGSIAMSGITGALCAAAITHVIK